VKTVSPARILLADDEPRLLRIVAMYLEMEGFEVLSATDGEAALVLLATSDFDLAILDVMMPGHDGIEVCQRLRSNHRTRKLPVLMFTALSSDVDVERARQAGATHLITKPYSLPGLGSLVKQALAQVPAQLV
jgi:DNA-binding response OmpR family regulator